MSSRLRAVALTAAAVLVSIPTVAGPASAGERSPGVRSAYHGWVGAVERADCAGTQVARRYTTRAILLATFTPYVQGRRGITEYFDALTCKPDLEVSTQRITTGRSGGSGYATGLYTFSYTGTDGAPVVVPARFTFVFEMRGGRWTIVNHHSSQVP
jgi:hypothetical protein